jgi:hypothetical protein
MGKIVDQVSDVLWSKLSLKRLTVPDHNGFFLDIAVKFQERCNFSQCYQLQRWKAQSH